MTAISECTCDKNTMQVEPLMKIESDISNKSWGAVLDGQAWTGAVWILGERAHCID